MTGFNCAYVTSSLLLTAATLAVGISFFAPYWLSNIPAVKSNELNFTNGATYISDLPGLAGVEQFPDRGLWAQCGLKCYWFWSNNYTLQTVILTPLKWHLATQILYFIGATIILFCEIYARVQMCCSPRKRVYVSLGVILLFSALVQLGAVATFGGGACRSPYNAIADPAKFTKYLGQVFVNFGSPYLGWTYWMAVVGDMLTVVCGFMFLITACCRPSKDY